MYTSISVPHLIYFLLRAKEQEIELTSEVLLQYQEGNLEENKMEIKGELKQKQYY